ncbi:MAG: nucleotidyltransferase family protein [Bacteroidales bacterium]|nr:nucleotidyltransferase family protein [Candidatus Cacconaster merdequi]
MNDPFNIVCSLVRNRLFGTYEEIPAGVVWEEVLECAVQHEVNAVCYGAVKSLPHDRQPSFALMLKWDVSAQAIKEMYNRRLAAAREVCDLLGKEGVNVVMLKGFSLASYYPEPFERESADVDILTFHDREKSDSIMKGHGIKVEGSGHHTSFKYKDILFENHGTDHEWDFNFRKSDHRVLDYLDKCAHRTQRTSDGLLVFEPDVTAVFLVKHLRQHLRWNCSLNIKQFADLALLLSANPGMTDKLLQQLRTVGLRHFGIKMIYISEKLTGINLQVKAGLLSRAAASFLLRFVIPGGHRSLILNGVVARDIVVDRVHKWKERRNRKH